MVDARRRRGGWLSRGGVRFFIVYRSIRHMGRWSRDGDVNCNASHVRLSFHTFFLSQWVLRARRWYHGSRKCISHRRPIPANGKGGPTNCKESYNNESHCCRNVGSRSTSRLTFQVGVSWLHHIRAYGDQDTRSLGGTNSHRYPR